MDFKTNKRFIIFLPGNPSVPGVYVPFLDSLVEELGSANTDYEILHHLGQSNKRVKNYKKILLKDVIADHKESINKLIKENEEKQIILISHSLGSAVSISLYEEMKDRVDRFIILCPFLGPSINNQSYLKLFRNPVSRKFLMYASFAILSNKRVSTKFFHKWLGENKLNQKIIYEIKKPRYIKNFFSLVSGYFESFDELRVKEKVSGIDPHKSYFLFAKEDFWVPEELFSVVPSGAKTDILENISHDFCLFEKEYTQVVEYMGRDIKDF